MHAADKGSGTLWIAMGPMTVVEDGSTSVAIATLDNVAPNIAAFTWDPHR